MSQELNNPDDGMSVDDLNLLTIDDFQALVNTGRKLSRELALEQLLQNILQSASDLTDSSDTSVILRNDFETSLYFAAATGEEAEWVLSNFGIHSKKQIPIEGSNAGAVYLSGKSLVENVTKEHYSGVDDTTNTVTKSMVCVPLRVGDETLGVMQVLNKKEGIYTQRDRVILEHLADQASVAIRNAKLLSSLLAHSGLYGSTLRTGELFDRVNLLNQPAKTETLTVLFADMRGFTQLFQALYKPVLVQQRLSEFITLLSQLVIENDGVVNKFLGDGVMALFQDEESSVRAVKCAFSMVEQFSKMKQQWNDEGNQQLDFLDLGVGIATDEVILGGVGSGDFRDYTAIGTAVNLAAAFVSDARDGRRILCDQLTYHNVTDIVSKTEAPKDFLLQAPGQTTGITYKCYHLKSLKKNQPVRVFISHSHEDRQYVEQLIDSLKGQGVKPWYSVTDIPKGTLWSAEINKAVSQCNWMVVVVSKNSDNTDGNARWVSREVDLAMTAEHLENRIIPIIIDEIDPRKVNQYLATMQAIHTDTCNDVTEALIKRFSMLENVSDD
ncbi:MAG: TIR domain-containing protein [Gammaproteobacteria bacterium]|nr:TIR domain-containing protein [Gammaproteobacteria bacterium]